MSVKSMLSPAIAQMTGYPWAIPSYDEIFDNEDMISLFSTRKFCADWQNRPIYGGQNNRAPARHFRFTQINELRLTHPGVPREAMAVADADNPRDSYVYLRGDKNKRGPTVPRRFLEALSHQRETLEQQREDIEMSLADIHNHEEECRRLLAGRVVCRPLKRRHQFLAYALLAGLPPEALSPANFPLPSPSHTPKSVQAGGEDWRTVTRRLPDAVETRMRELFDTRLNVDDSPMTAAELVEAVKTADAGTDDAAKTAAKTALDAANAATRRSSSAQEICSCAPDSSSNTTAGRTGSDRNASIASTPSGLRPPRCSAATRARQSGAPPGQPASSLGG